MTGGFTGFSQVAATGPLLLALTVCLLAGLVSFASPCVVPLVPGYLSYLAAVVGVDEQPAPGALKPPPAARWRVAGSAALFVAGFTAVFLLGTVAVLGMTTTLITNQLVLQRAGGVVTIVMGLVFVGFIPVLQRRQGSHRSGCRRSPGPRCWERCSRWVGPHAWGPPSPE
jgi:cytochrome c-type biogenesis protein